jgi:hypothetical protein
MTTRLSILILGAAVLLAVPATAQADFCWRHSYGRGVGTIPNACPNGENNAGLCYPLCRSGYAGVGPVCWQSCPPGYSDFGVGCSKPGPYGRGGGYWWSIGDAPFSDSGQYSRCERDNGGAGKCEKNGLIVYPKCNAGYRAVGCCVCSPVCPNGLIDSGATCTKNTEGRGAGTLPTCSTGLQYDAGLCYQPAKAGYTGVGPVAWGNCPPASPVNCGAGCAATDAECANAIKDQVLSVLEMVVTIVETAVTGGAGSALKAGFKAGMKTTIKNFASKLTKDQVRKKIKEVVTDAGKTIAEAQVENLTNAAAGEEFDFTSLDPTGIAAIVTAYNHPVCAVPTTTATAPAPAPAVVTKPIVPGNLYKLINKKSGLVLQVHGGGTEDGALITQWTNGDGDNGKWWFRDAGGGSFRFVNKRSNKVLDVYGGSTTDGANLIQWYDNGGANQLWTVEAQSDGYYLLVSKNSGKALAILGATLELGGAAVQWTKATADNFKWRFEPTQ